MSRDDEMKQRTSIVVPCYNGEATIDRCINSIYMQECDCQLELIIVDDGSTDCSKDRINSWIPKFEQKGHVLKYVFQENKGPGDAVNTGLKYVTGEYLSLLDADDCFLPDSIKKRMHFLIKNPDFVGVRSNGWQDKQGERKLFDADPERKTNTNLFDGLIGGKATNWAGSYMIRTDVLFSFYPTRDIYASKFGQHMQILLPVAYKNKFGYIDEPLMIYFLQENSHSKAETPEEQQKKNDYNFYGYQDIYRYMVNLIVLDEKERSYYLNIIDSWQCNHEMQKAMMKRDKSQMRRCYRAYKATGRMTLNEEINYFFIANPIKAIALRLYRRIKMIFNH